MARELNFQWQVLFIAFAILLNLNHIASKPEPYYSCVHLDGELNCHSTDPNPYKSFGSKTPYPAESKDFVKHYELQGCTPKIFYLLNRHATRYPGEDYIQYFNEQLPILKEKIIASFEKSEAKLCLEDIKKLKEWSPTMTVKDDKKLSATGAVEAEELGERLRKRFPEILGMKYSPLRFVIEYTSKKRTKDTAENFCRGIFTEQDYENIKGKTNDKLLQYHKKCKDMMKNCKAEKIKLGEFEEFENGTLMQKVLESVSKRIGFNINKDDMMYMQSACSFGYALNISDAWCAVFSHDDLKVLEYLDDIESYYKRSYGNVVNYQQACPVIKYLVDLFELYEKTKTNKVVFQFTHSGAMVRFYSLIGLFRDNDKLKSEDFCTQNDRKWRTSSVVPFNTNIVFILYDCYGDLKIVTLHNEKPVTIDGCSNKLCSLEDFYNKYQPIARNCDLKRICDVC